MGEPYRLSSYRRLTNHAWAVRVSQEMVVENCGDVKDRFPCRLCGAKAPRECGVSIENRRIASQAINDAGGYDALMAAMLAVVGRGD